jgi:hypothetical protein
MPTFAPLQTGPRYVGVPSMNAICKAILRHEKISTHLGDRVQVEHTSSGWVVSSHSNETYLGTFNWLVSGDRMMVASHRFASTRPDTQRVALISFWKV